MRPVRHLCLIACLAACLPGCAETKYRSDAMPPLVANQARIVFFRNASFVGADMLSSILYDGAPVGNSKPGTYFYIDTTPGTHDVSTTSDANNHLGLTLAPGETRYIKTGLGLGQFAGRIEPETVSSERALRELPELTFAPSGPSYVAGKPGQSEQPAPVPPQPSCAAPSASGTASCAAPADAAPVNAADTTPQPSPTAAPVQSQTQDQPAAPAKAPQNPAENAPGNALDTGKDKDDQSAEFHLGTSSNSVEDLARREKQCEPVRGAGLISSDGPIEYYREQCRDGRVFRAKCQFRECVEIDSN